MAKIEGDGGGGRGPRATAPQRIFAGAVVFFVLVIAADIEQTSTLAVAFAYVILLSVFWTAGPVAFRRISNAVGAA